MKRFKYTNEYIDSEAKKMYTASIRINFEDEDDLDAFCDFLDQREDLNYSSYTVVVEERD